MCFDFWLNLINNDYYTAKIRTILINKKANQANYFKLQEMLCTGVYAVFS